MSFAGHEGRFISSCRFGDFLPGPEARIETTQPLRPGIHLGLMPNQIVR
jgi:hypothetical protein